MITASSKQRITKWLKTVGFQNSVGGFARINHFSNPGDSWGVVSSSHYRIHLPAASSSDCHHHITIWFKWSSGLLAWQHFSECMKTENGKIVSTDYVLLKGKALKMHINDDFMPGGVCLIKWSTVSPNDMSSSGLLLISYFKCHLHFHYFESN